MVRAALEAAERVKEEEALSFGAMIVEANDIGRRQWPFAGNPEPAPTALQLSAVMFTKTLADDIDKRNGVPPQRETQKRAAKIVREEFFAKPDAKE